MYKVYNIPFGKTSPTCQHKESLDQYVQEEQISNLKLGPDKRPSIRK